MGCPALWSRPAEGRACPESDYGTIRFGTNVPITAIFVLFGIFRSLQIVSGQTGGDAPTDLILRDVPLRTSILLWLLTFAVIIYAQLLSVSPRTRSRPRQTLPAREEPSFPGSVFYWERLEGGRR